MKRHVNLYPHKNVASFVSHEWQPFPEREILYNRPVQNIKRYPVQPRQEILTYPDLATKDHQVRELVVYDTNIQANVLLDDKVEPVYNDYMRYVQIPVPRFDTCEILKEVGTESWIYWDEMHMEISMIEHEVEEEYRECG